MNHWQGKVALVTGGSSGLGRALARAFVGQGAKVAIAARTKASLDRTADELGRSGEMLAIAADVTRQDDVERMVAQTRERFGRLDVLVNSAGSSTRGWAIETTPEEFQALWELNFLAVVRCCRAAVPLLLETHGHVVNIGSLASKVASRHLGAYPASKFAVAAYSQQLRLELGPQGLHVLLVCPGPIARDSSGERYSDKSEGLPESARKPGAGVKLSAIDPDRLARRILKACCRRRPELVWPGRARLLFAAAQLAPRLGDWLVRKMT